MNTENLHEKFMRAALRQAKIAGDLGDAPIGCVIVHDGIIVARAGNRREFRQDATRHAEILAIRAACRKLKSWRLEDCDLYVTLEPCYMCAGAIIQARVRAVYFGAADPKGGAVVHGPRTFAQPTIHHRPEIYDDIGAGEAAALLKDFFATRR